MTTLPGPPAVPALGAGGRSRMKSCPFCKNTDHCAHQCQVVTDVGKRRQIVERDRLCFNCLVPNHRADTCRNSFRCQICRGKHHTALHRNQEDLTQPANRTQVNRSGPDNTPAPLTAQSIERTNTSATLLTQTMTQSPPLKIAQARGLDQRTSDQNNNNLATDSTAVYVSGPGHQDTPTDKE